MQQRIPVSNHPINSLTSLMEFEQLYAELVEATLNNNLQEDLQANEAVDALNSFDLILQTIYQNSHDGNIAVVEKLVTTCRENNLLANIYRSNIALEGSDLTFAAAKLKQLDTAWNNIITEAALAGFRESKFACSDEDWWRLFDSVNEHGLAIAILHEYIYHRDLTLSFLQGLFGASPRRLSEQPGEKFFTSATRDELITEFMPRVNLELAGGIDKYTQRVNAVIKAEELLLANFICAVTVKNYTEFEAQLALIMREHNLLFEIHKKFELVKIYKKHNRARDEARIIFHSRCDADLLRHTTEVWRQFYYMKMMNFFRGELTTPRDLRLIIKSIKSPLLLAEILRNHQPRIENKLVATVKLSPDVDVSFAALLRKIKLAGLSDDPVICSTVVAVNAFDRSLREIAYHASVGNVPLVSDLLAVARCDNPLLLLSVRLMLREGNEWRNMPAWVMRYHEVWNACLTETALNGLKKSVPPDSDKGWWRLLGMIEDVELSIAVLKEFIYHREPRRGFFETLLYSYNDDRTPDSGFEKAFVALAATPIEKIFGILKQDSSNDAELMQVLCSYQSAFEQVKTRLDAEITSALQTKSLSQLNLALFEIDSRYNLLLFLYKKIILQSIEIYDPYDKYEMGDFKCELSSKQPITVMKALSVSATKRHVDTIVERIFASNPDEASLREMALTIQHPRLLACFLHAFTRRRESSAGHFAAFYASTSSADESEDTKQFEDSDNDRKSSYSC